MTGRIRFTCRPALLGVFLLAAGAASLPAAFAQQRVGVDSAVNPNVTGIPPGALPRRLVLGQEIVFNERITTEVQGQTQVLFVDESTLSVGPNANMVIDQFVYDPNSGTGKMTASLTRGVFRFVGGKISKAEGAVTFRTPVGTIGIRGGVFLARVNPDCHNAGCQALSVNFIFGKGVTITGLNGASQTIYRPGFESGISGAGGSPSNPAPAPPGSSATMLAQLNGRAGGTGGAPVVPTEQTVANSGIASAISGNVNASVQAQQKTQPLQQAQQPRNVAPVVAQTELNNQNVQISGATATPVGGGQPVSLAQVLSNPAASSIQIASSNSTNSSAQTIGGGSTTGGSIIAGTGTGTTTGTTGTATTGTTTTGTTTTGTATTATTGTATATTTSTGTTTTGTTTTGTTTTATTGTATTGTTTTGTGSPPPVMITYAGIAKVSPNPPTTGGFINQATGYRVPYSMGMLQNGVFSVTVNGQQVTLSPLTAGATTAVTGIASTGATATGQATMTADASFFYANLTASNGQRLFIYGGVPVNGTPANGLPANGTGFYAPSPNQQFYAFTVQPDGALLSPSGSPQTIPFLPSNYGGTMPVLPGNVSPLYVTASPNLSFGGYNASANPTGSSPHFLQASLAVNGQGPSQSSALVVTTGAFSTSNTGAVVASGPVRGTVFPTASGQLVHVASGLATVPDGNGNNLFGGSTLSGFVLDQNQYDPAGNFSLNTASATPFTPPSSTTFNYAFNQPVTAAALPSGLCTTAACRPAMVETGWFGGIMQTSVGGAVASYPLTGTNLVQTYPSDNRVFSAFAGYDPLTSGTSGVNSLVLYFGAPGTPGVNGYARSAYINSQVYGAAEDPNDPAQITVSSPSGGSTTTALPTFASGSTLYPRLAMVTSGTVPSTGWMPAGVTPCSCQYLQWGYWTGQVGTPNTTGTGYSRIDTAAINTWVAGTPTVNLPTTGTGTYNGAAVGTVYNGGATYLAAGNFNASYSFANHMGSVGINNFDGASYSATVNGSGATYSGNLTGAGGFANRSGPVVGSFYGPGAVETGGSFNIQATSGPKYLASGIFAGR
jgi:trimeric autotransporter adhesin